MPVETLARSDRRVAATVEQWDFDENSFNTPGGLIDLATGEIRANIPEDYCRKLSGYTLASPDSECPLWLKFLHESWPGSKT